MPKSLSKSVEDVLTYIDENFCDETKRRSHYELECTLDGRQLEFKIVFDFSSDEEFDKHIEYMLDEEFP